MRATEKRRQMGDVGVIAQRYVLVLFGNSQKLELQPWQPNVGMTIVGAVRLEGRHLVPGEAAGADISRTARRACAARSGRRPSPSPPRGVDRPT